MIDCKPVRDLRTGVPGAEKDPRVLENLFTATNMTTLDKNMWLTTYTKGGKVFVSVDFQSSTNISGKWGFRGVDSCFGLKLSDSTIITRVRRIQSEE